MAIEPIKGFYVHDEVTGQDGVAKVSVDGVHEFVEDVTGAVESWLDEHPEATTTVQDGAIVTDKLADEAVTLEKIKVGDLGYVTPEQFGAVGDGVTDDTQAVQAAFNTEKTVFLKSVYAVSSTISVYSSVFTATNANILALTALDPVVHIAPSGQVKHLNINMIVNADGKGGAAIRLGSPKQSCMNLYVLNSGVVGVDTGTNSANNENILNIGVMGSTTGVSETGVKIGNSDTFFTSINVYNCRHGVEVYEYGNLMADVVHVWLAGTQMDNYYAGSAVVFVNTSNDRAINVQWLFQDNIQTAILGTSKINAIIGTLGTNKSDIPSDSDYYTFKISGTPTASHVYFTEYRGRDSYYPIFDNFSNDSVYGCNTSMHNTLNLTLNATFSDLNDAPPIGDWRVPWNTANLPFGANSHVKSEAVGDFIVQTCYRGQDGTYLYKRQRKLGESTWTPWVGVILTTLVG